MTIELKNIIVSFGAMELFQTEHLLIPEGSRVGIVGDNGSGKSTLLALIEGTITSQSGTVTGVGSVAVIPQLIDEQMTKSGGEQTKQKIRAAISSYSGVLLADEPTNHLDEKGVAYLVNELNNYYGTLLIVSHNRSFLNRTVKKILEIKDGKLTLFEGNYDAYLAQKEQIAVEHERAYEKYQKERQEITKAITTVSKKSDTTRKTPRRMGNSEARLHKMGNQRAKKHLDNKTKALKTRLDKLEKMEKRKIKQQLIIPFSPTQKLHKKVVMEANHLHLSLGNKQLIIDSQFKLYNGSKTALLGANGSGKTSLLKEILMGNPMIASIHGLKIGYFSQTFETLNNQQTVFDNVSHQSIQSVQTIRDVLAHMQFRGETIFKKIATLSGGERSKVALSKLLLGDYNLLLLDEPTNHLDISSINVLEEALVAYQGTVLFITHDQEFIEQVATEKWQIKNKQLQPVRKEKIRTSSEEALVQKRLVLENRKTVILSELSFADQQKKVMLEKELKKVLQELKN